MDGVRKKHDKLNNHRRGQRIVEKLNLFWVKENYCIAKKSSIKIILLLPLLNSLN